MDARDFDDLSDLHDGATQSDRPRRWYRVRPGLSPFVLSGVALLVVLYVVVFLATGDPNSALALTLLVLGLVAGVVGASRRTRRGRRS